MSKLSLNNLGKSFGATAAVSDISLSLKEGEFVSLLGPSGCGKTTILRMIAGFIRPTSGTIEMNGEVLSSESFALAPERRGMSMIFQSYAIWPNMTVSENVAFGLKLRKLPADELKRRLDAVLDVVKLSHLRDRYPAELSGGQQQRVALARAIVIEPEVLLMDEPLSNLDANLREEMRSEIRRLHDAFHITTVYVTHDQAEAMVTSDRIVVMNHGRIEQVDDPVSLYMRPQTRFVASFIGRTNFLDGKLEGGQIAFSGFSIPAGLVGCPAEPARNVSLSVRPQNIRIHKTKPSAPDVAWCIEGQVFERSFLGEHWDYVVRVRNSNIVLRASAPPSAIYEAGDNAWLEIDPKGVVLIPGPTQ